MAMAMEMAEMEMAMLEIVSWNMTGLYNVALSNRVMIRMGMGRDGDGDGDGNGDGDGDGGAGDSITEPADFRHYYNVAHY